MALFVFLCHREEVSQADFYRGHGGGHACPLLPRRHAQRVPHAPAGGAQIEPCLAPAPELRGSSKALQRGQQQHGRGGIWVNYFLLLWGVRRAFPPLATLPRILGGRCHLLHHWRRVETGVERLLAGDGVSPRLARLGESVAERHQPNDDLQPRSPPVGSEEEGTGGKNELTARREFAKHPLEGACGLVPRPLGQRIVVRRHGLLVRLLSLLLCGCCGRHLLLRGRLPLLPLGGGRLFRPLRLRGLIGVLVLGDRVPFDRWHVRRLFKEKLLRCRPLEHLGVHALG
mmetsp:Transcript_40647/g.129652  ORF Transcript_40647/g.129652 Transcript_40647/m.129652 type:complete len:286 (-) Transcript_40647:71-928(-)